MLTKRHILSAILGATLSVAVSVPASAAGKDRGPAKSSQSYKKPQAVQHQSRHQPTVDSRRAYAQRSISPAEAKSIARSRVKGGEVVDISRRGDTYRVRVIAKNGKVVDVYIDANTGRVKK